MKESPSFLTSPLRIQSKAPLKRVAFFVVGYALFLQFFRLFVMSLLTYVLMSDRGRLQDVAETYGALELPLIGLGSAIFVWMVRAWSPFETGLSPHRRRLMFLGSLWPGFWRGWCLGFALVGGLWVTHVYRNEGFWVQTTEEDVLPLAQWFLRWMALFVWIASEEWIFRVRLFSLLRERYSAAVSCVVVSLIYVAFKTFQFHLGWMHMTTWFLASMILTLRAFHRFHFWNGAGLWFAFLFVIHSVFGLPILGHEGHGLFFMRTEDLSETLYPRLLLFLSGGPGGPLSSGLLQGLMALEIVRWARRGKKFLLISNRPSLK